LKKIPLFIISVFCLLALMRTAKGQTVTVTPFSFDQDLRVLQLQGKLPLDYSMNVRPISFSKKFSADSLYNLIGGDKLDNFKERKVDFWKGHGKIALLPITSITKFTSHHPYGWSDGALMPVNGLQQIISTGFYTEIGPFSLQIKPEILYAQNSPYQTTSLYGQTNLGGKISKVLPGQSRAALNLGPVSFAVSTENIWWGPGQFTGLMMTNNPSGFLHLSFNTRKPLKTPIGKFEWQLISGRPIGNDNTANQVYNLKSFREARGGGISSSEEYSKYTNALTINYSPSFIKNIHIGFTRSFISSAGDVLGPISERVGIVKAFLPVIDGIFKEKRIAFEDSIKWNQQASLYLRWLFPKAKAEVYVEYGWNDHKFNVRDMLMSPRHSSAYLVGVKKVFQINKDHLLDANLEYNQMGESEDKVVRPAGPWYYHGGGSDFTHLGEVTGAGLESGSNLLTLSLNVRKGQNQIGFIFEKINIESQSNGSRWSYLSSGLIGRKKINAFMVNARLSGIHSKNYGWENGKNRFNFMGMMGVSYFF
jgi:hypothetical protein